MDHPNETSGLPVGRWQRLGQVLAVFLKLGSVGFGGPAVHFATIEEETVQRRGWLARQHRSIPSRPPFRDLEVPDVEELILFITGRPVTMPTAAVAVVRVPIERWGDLETLFGARGACGGCWCMWWPWTPFAYETLCVREWNPKGKRPFTPECCLLRENRLSLANATEVQNDEQVSNRRHCYTSKPYKRT